MRPISEHDIRVRIERDNPWWADHTKPIPEAASPRRVYFDSFKALALNFGVRRATVLLGPRRVGKTYMVKQLISDAIAEGIDPKAVLYVSLDTPIYSGLSLEHFFQFMPADENGTERFLVVFDEIQYRRDWEVHLKDVVDNYPSVKFLATGSTAAALKLKSQESGAGRFSDFMLPPLTFYEFLMFLGEDSKLIESYESPIQGDFGPEERRIFRALDIQTLNDRFIDYLNFGGYPEAVLNAAIRLNPDQFIRNDIIDKVLLKDLPSLYGIDEIQELNRLFSFIAYNAGNEASLQNLSQESGIAKPTIKKYIEYLESAFLIMKLGNVDDNCRSLKRQRNFKVYLNNPSMRAALFAPVDASDTEGIGHLAECAIFSQWQHSPGFRQLRYARWRHGEVDIVHLAGARQLPTWLGEIKWSDRIMTHRGDEIGGMQQLLKRRRSIRSAIFTTKTVTLNLHLEGRPVAVMPSALYCYSVGRNITTRLAAPIPVADSKSGSKRAA